MESLTSFLLKDILNVRVHPFLAVIGTAQTSGAKPRLHVDDCDGCRQKIEAKNGLGLFVQFAFTLASI